jgi:hypothetical protein
VSGDAGAVPDDVIDAVMRWMAVSEHDAKDFMSVPAVAEAFADAARLRSLAATMDNHLNRDATFTGAQVAAILRDGGE